MIMRIERADEQRAQGLDVLRSTQQRAESLARLERCRLDETIEQTSKLESSAHISIFECFEARWWPATDANREWFWPGGTR